MPYEAFTFDTEDYARELTGQSHQTLYWLHKHGYLDAEQVTDLLSRMVVVPIRNNPKFGQRLLARFFGDECASNSFVFPITLIDADADKPVKSPKKPKLEIVKNDDS